MAKENKNTLRAKNSKADRVHWSRTMFADKRCERVCLIKLEFFMKSFQTGKRQGGLRAKVCTLRSPKSVLSSL